MYMYVWKKELHNINRPRVIFIHYPISSFLVDLPFIHFACPSSKLNRKLQLIERLSADVRKQKETKEYK